MKMMNITEQQNNRTTEQQNNRTTEQNSRNYSIDSLKFLCAVFVVMIHLQLAKIGPIGFRRLLSCAVPCFFMTSGYLLFAKEGMAARCKKGAIRITKLFLTIWTIWFACNLIFYFDDFNFWECFSLRELFLCFAMNFTLGRSFGLFGIDVLWYLQAYIYVLVISYFVAKHHLWKFAFWSIPLLVIGLTILGVYRFPLFGIDATTPRLVRNFLFVGVPCFSIGAFIKYKWDYVKQIQWKTLVGFFVVFFALGKVENKLTSLPAFFIGGDTATKAQIIEATSIAVVCLATVFFLIFLKINQKKPNIISMLGEKYSLYIYLFHFPMIHLLRYFGIQNKIVLLALVILCAIFITWVFRKVKILH